MSDKETIFTPLRASNTVKTLKPTEVAIGPPVIETFNEASPGVPKPEPVFVNIDGDYTYLGNPDGTADIFKVSVENGSPKLVRDEEANRRVNEFARALSANMETVYGPPEENLKKLMQGRFDELPKDDECFAYYDPENDKSPLERRVQKLEEQMDALLDRLQKYNVRAQHRI